MNILKKCFSTVLFCILILIVILIINNMINDSPKKSTGGLSSFLLNAKDIIYQSQNSNTNDLTDSEREKIIENAKEMAGVKWIPDYDLKDKSANYIFKKGVTYTGIPYSMDAVQVNSDKNFLSRIKKSKIIYGNDCSAFVSFSWGVKRQTTLSIYKAMKGKQSIDKNAYVVQISWESLKPGDALLREDGSGKGHIMLFCSQDNDKIIVYEQNVPTTYPYQPFPVARKDIRSKNTLIKENYIPIRLVKK